MTSKKIKYKEYKKLLNLVAYKLVKSGNSFKHRKEYSYAGKKYSYEKIIKKIKSNGKNYTSNGAIARFIEKTVVKDNTNLDFLPSSVKIGESKYKKKHYVAAIQLTVNYRKKHNKNPTKVKISYKQIFKKYGRSTRHGCDNMGQNNSVNCGPHMVQEIIRNLTGKVIPQRTLAAVIGTTSEGSDHDGINTAFEWFSRTYGIPLDVTWKNFSELGWSGLKKIEESSNQDYGLHEMYRYNPGVFEGYGHYTNYDTIYNDNTVDVHNSLGDRCDEGCFCGYVENRSKSEARTYLSGISQKSVLIVTRK